MCVCVYEYIYKKKPNAILFVLCTNVCIDTIDVYHHTHIKQALSNAEASCHTDRQTHAHTQAQTARHRLLNAHKQTKKRVSQKTEGRDIQRGANNQEEEAFGPFELPPASVEDDDVLAP